MLWSKKKEISKRLTDSITCQSRQNFFQTNNDLNTADDEIKTSLTMSCILFFYCDHYEHRLTIVCFVVMHHYIYNMYHMHVTDTHTCYIHTWKHTCIHTKSMIGILPFWSERHVTFWIRLLTHKNCCLLHLTKTVTEKIIRWETIIRLPQPIISSLFRNARWNDGTIHNSWKNPIKEFNTFFPCWTNSELITGQLTPMSWTSLQWYKPESGCRFTKD